MVYANFRAYEGNTSGTKTIQVDFKARKFVIVNDSSTRTLQFKFNESETFGTLRPTEEAIIEDIYQRTVYLNSPDGDVAYRVWAFG